LNVPEVCGCRPCWQGASRPQDAPCNDEQRSQRALQSCDRVRSELTQQVSLNKHEKVFRDMAFSEELSGQSRI
jgi:hypothetical protein